MNLLEALEERILIADGAMGTLLYSYGVDRSFEELNLTHEDQIIDIHRRYIEAGADVIQTNTYGANYLKLSRYGLQDQVKKINAAAVRNAKLAATKDTFVLGTIGGIAGTQVQNNDKEEIKRSFREQLYCLLMEGVDGLLLETYYDLEELTSVLQIAKEETDKPIITNVSMHEPGTLENGTSLQEALNHLEDFGANIVGVNCRLGPFHMLQALKTVGIPNKTHLAAYPNASLPAYREGKLIYENKPEYFRSCAIDFHKEGVRLFGGCCGTTPEHIQAISKSIKGLAPITKKKTPKSKSKVRIRENNNQGPDALLDAVENQHTVIVELDTPKHLNTEAYLKGAKVLKEAGVDAITMADNSLATPRISNIAMASIIKEKLNIPTIVHLNCRDRNLIGLQSHIMGLHTLGLHHILAITGDPTKLGDFPGATSVFDVRSFDLIKLVKQLNKGLSYSGKSFEEFTFFKVGAAFNPNINRLDKAVERMKKKIECGADYFLTQPIYSKEKIIQLSESTKHIEKPIFVGIMPLTSSRNAEFLHNEVPGFKLTNEVRDRMRMVAEDKQKSITQGLEITKELLDTAMKYFNGIYLVTPFNRYDMTAELVKYIHEKSPNVVQSKHRSIIH
ncbi:bifunctional homocysteine S-methyltransferase/methylenetetrahydrofolate reductase [Oceanobacillus senegalensis]|uniref:bifunctional homocysteine S-methyltransferase/methylenetetrahydrofolate reductase n=1 Tax=Oceanobacillus senegalensis TaxID=1936063 RepID=UPI000A3113B7|nr:bifunctional homocysteine S-methyltransferase/methylenetetrahydrofolate reductase [Oceanobacillus senegalensis]